MEACHIVVLVSAHGFFQGQLGKGGGGAFSDMAFLLGNDLVVIDKFPYKHPIL